MVETVLNLNDSNSLTPTHSSLVVVSLRGCLVRDVVVGYRITFFTSRHIYGLGKKLSCLYITGR